MGVEIKLEEKIFDILKMLQKMPAPEMMRFDVRDYEFRRVVSETTEEQIKKFGTDLVKDILRYTAPKTNIVAKTAIGKKWAQKGKLDFDYDASLFANCVYWLAMFQGKEPGPIVDKPEHKYKKNEYEFTCDGICRRGDTMNSWETTLNEFCRQRGESYIVGWHNRYIPEDYSSWVEFLSVPENYKQPMPEYITEFMNIVYTIGNFIPVPFKSREEGEFNSPRGTSTSRDYWDLALFCIYNYYTTGEPNDLKKRILKNSDNNVALCTKWLDGFGKGPDGWNHFVEQNFLQDFVNQENGGYGCPKELWKGHFSGKVLPGENEEFSESFTNASAWILARGVRIASAVKDQLTDLSEEKLKELARRMAGEEGK